jgi:peptidoglycan/LPS O-acetylase OafA/YrhL
MVSANRLPGLDGFRAISIVLVLIGHLHGTRGFGTFPALSTFGDLAHLGVQVFFVISGFLITTLLLEEQRRTGTISLKRFYIRRSLRIFPAFFAFLAALLGAQALGWIQLSTVDFVTAATYTVNYHVERSWYVGHLWSLSVEEQFYLLWPLAMVFVATRKGAVRIALLVFLAAPVVRVAMHVAIPSGPLRDLEVFPAVADAIAAGCLMALLRERLLQQDWYSRLTGSPWVWCCLAPVLAINKFRGYTIVDALGSPLALAALAMLIETGTRRVSGPVAAALNWRPVVFLGTLSYSLYLWQQPFLNRQCAATPCEFPINLGLAIACALASYFLLERPLVGLRGRFAATGPAAAETSRRARPRPSPATAPIGL